MRKYGFFLLAIVLMAQSGFSDEFKNFATRDGARLMDGDKELRFISFNIPNLHYVEDDMQFERKNPFRMPDEFEINDALETIKQMGGQVVRIYTLPVFQANESPDTPKYVLGPGKFNEDAFKTLDKVLELCNKHGIRIIIPFVNNFQWWGGAMDYAAFRGKKKDDFWTDPQLIDDFKKTVEFVVNRKNTITGVPYKEDKSILAWETGNETQCPHSWTKEILSYIKSLDSKHLLMDGYLTSILRDESLTDDIIDIVQTHHYEKNPQEMLDHIQTNVEKVRGKKPYLLGEFGFVSTEATRAVLNKTIQEKINGALIWSLRYHYKDGGFFWHSEPDGGDFFKSYHWTGYNSGLIYDEANLMAMMRVKAYEIQGLPIPAVPAPKAPKLLPISHPGLISWQGSAGASGYDIQRATKAQSVWRTIAENVSDADYQYRPQFSDTTAEIGIEYYYMVTAKNASGTCNSNTVGPVKCNSLLLIDEFENESKIFFRSKNFFIKRNESRKFKEDIHLFSGSKDSWLIYQTAGPIRSIKMYSFFAEKSGGLEFSLSKDGKQFEPLNVEKQDFAAGKGEYGYQNPALFEVKDISGQSNYLKINLTGPANLSRIEIEYIK